MKIKKLYLEQYGPIVKADNVDFNEGLNIVVGKNGSGKTILLDLLNYFSGQAGFEQKYINTSFHHVKEGTEKADEVILCQLNAEVKEEKWIYKIVDSNIIGKIQPRTTVNNEDFGASTKKLLVEYIKSKRTIASTLSQQSPYETLKGMKPQSQAPEGTIDVTASIIQDIYDSIIKIIFEKQESIKTQVQLYTQELNNSLVDFDKEIKLDFQRAGNFIYCVDRRKNEFDFSQLSAGEIQYLYFTFRLKSLLTKEKDSTVVLIDEPELHLHSSQVFKLAELIEEVASQNQVVLATHSSEFIDYFSNKAQFYLLSGNFSKITNVGEQLEAFRSLGIRFLSNYLTGPYLLIENSSGRHLPGDVSLSSTDLVKRLITEEGQRKICISAMGSSPDDENKTKLLEEIMGSTPVNKVVLLDSDKLIYELSRVELSKWLAFIKSKSKDKLIYLPFYEVENILLQPKVLKSIEFSEEDFWNTVKKNFEYLQASYIKTLAKRAKTLLRFGKILETNNPTEQKENMEHYSKEVSKIFGNPDELINRAKSLLEAIIKSKDWRWLPGKEALKAVVLAKKPNFWQLFKNKNLKELCEGDVVKLFKDIEACLLEAPLK